MVKPIYTLNGSKFSSFPEFVQCFSDVVLKDYQWSGSLDAFNDILRGGFGTPDGGFILHWEHSALSRQHLGYPATVLRLEELITQCHSSNIQHLQQRLLEAKQERGETLFDTIVEIIQVHGSGGNEAEDGVELLLL